MKKVKCSTETLSKILMYLQTKPYEEVYLLINEIIDQINKSNAAMNKSVNESISKPKDKSTAVKQNAARQENYIINNKPNI